MKNTNQYSIWAFCERMKERHAASDCRSFSGRMEALVALFDVMQLGAKDCVFVSALAPSDVVKAVQFFGGVPVFCDVTPDSFCIDHRSLENAVRQVVSVDRLYPRAVIAENFCGVPFSLRAVKNVCDRMGLILIEDCGNDYGGESDGILCGSVGDYSIIGLGDSTVFRTGGSGCLLTASAGNPLSEHMKSCDLAGYQSADRIYADELINALDALPGRLEENLRVLGEFEKILSESDFWIQRYSGRQKPSGTAAVIVAPGTELREAALQCMSDAGLFGYARKLHAHTKSCFDRCGRGLKNIENATAIAPRAFAVDIGQAANDGALPELLNCFRNIAENIHES